MTKTNNTDRPVIYPFAALVGQERMKLALILNVIDPSLSGVLIRGEKGTAKSTAVRGLAELLPEKQVARGCEFNCPPDPVSELCPRCRERWDSGEEVAGAGVRVQVVELPVGATEDRVLGTLDLEAAIKSGEKSFSPGLLAQANRNILYVDEVNLLDDHLVDILLDSAAMGINSVERESISFSHPARFTLVGTMNPEEGEIRPQLLDRFGLCVAVEGLSDPAQRVEIIRRRLDFEADPAAFAAQWAAEGRKLTERMTLAAGLIDQIEISGGILDRAVDISLAAGTDGHRADLVMIKAARASAAFHGRTAISDEDLATAARLTLPHRIKRRPFEEMVFDIDSLLAQ